MLMSDEIEDVNEIVARNDEIIEYSSRENALITELTLIHEKLANMYIGSKIALLNSNNPDRLRQASVSIRELIDSLSKFDARVPFEKDVSTLKDQANRLVEATKNIASLDTSDLSKITPESLARIRKVNIAVVTFQDYMDTSGERARQKQRVLLETYDPTQSNLPQVDQDALLTKWMDLDSYFNRVAHSAETTLEEFEENVAVFEEILIELLNPSSSDNFDEIDQLIEELENE